MSQSGDVETPLVKTRLPKSSRHPPWAEALETGSRIYPRRVLPIFKLRLILAAHISSGCCTKVSHTNWLELLVRVNALGSASGESDDVQIEAAALGTTRVRHCGRERWGLRDAYSFKNKLG